VLLRYLVWECTGVLKVTLTAKQLVTVALIDGSSCEDRNTAPLDL
jgi:hypothetical protein